MEPLATLFLPKTLLCIPTCLLLFSSKPTPYYWLSSACSLLGDGDGGVGGRLAGERAFAGGTRSTLLEPMDPICARASRCMSVSAYECECAWECARGGL